jgi:hypothetical protein
MSAPVGLNFWWARNDGLTGHVWVSARDLARLHEEMAAQSMGLELSEGEVRPAELDRALEGAQIEPLVLEDSKLWSDWLRFLEGAAQNGGLVVR